ncbi:MAG: hypothetical protein M3P32_06855 [Chloroflexota bacterium]|nr:hypothetical protein [Chloroflexota bacterium]
MNGRWVIRLFPRVWRRRYADELVEILELQPPGVRQLIGLLYCALDAHLDPQVIEGGDFEFMEGRPTMRTRILAGAAVGGGLLLLFGLIFTVSGGLLVVRLAVFYALATVGLIGIHRRQVSHSSVLAWLGFAPAVLAYTVSTLSVLSGLVDANLPSIAGRQFGVVAQEAFWVTSALFGVVTLAIGVLPRLAALALAIGAAMVMIGVFIGPPSELAMELVARVGVIMYGGGFIWLGLSGWAARPRPMTSAA